MPPWVFIAGRVGNSIVVALLMLALIAAIGRVLYGVAIPWDRLPAILVTLVVGAAAFCCLGIALTAAIPSQDAAAPIVNALLLPLYFLSGVFIPEDRAARRRHRLRRPLPGPPLLRGLLRRLHPGGAAAPASTGTTSRSSRSGASPASLLAIRFFRWTPRAG